MNVSLEGGIGLLSGGYFDYENPEKAELELTDVIIPLCNVCRYSGQLPLGKFYSVAQHAVNVSRLLDSRDDEWAGLFHDTAEAFTNDIPTPLKTAVPMLKTLEVKIEREMARRFNFQFPLSPAVKLADLVMLKIEKEHIKGDLNEWEVLEGVDYTEEHLARVNIQPMSPVEAYCYFQGRLHELA